MASTCAVLRSSNASSCCRERIKAGELIQFSDHYAEKGLDSFEAARQRGLEGIVAKKRSSAYAGKALDAIGSKSKSRSARSASSEATPIPRAAANISARWCSACMTRRDASFTWGRWARVSIRKRSRKSSTHCSALKTKQNPFYGEIGGLRKVQFVRPELVAEIKFAEWTHETAEGGMKLRAPVFMGLRFDKAAEECRLEEAVAG